MTEAEALKRFIPILGRISTPHERQVITRNILERIAGQQTSVMGINHSQAGALAWPADPAKAKAFENALNVAVDGGEFLSLLHRHDRRHFQIEELASWPDCPAIAPDSPLTFWLGEPAPVQDTATPAPVAVETPHERRARWLDMFEAEEKREKRGALQRLANSEGVDRSNMGKDIAKAREERDTERRAGGWTAQLVQDGKRKRKR